MWRLLQRAQVREEVRIGEVGGGDGGGWGGGGDGRADGSKLNSCQHLSSVNVLSRVCQSAFPRITVPAPCLPASASERARVRACV